MFRALAGQYEVRVRRHHTATPPQFTPHAVPTPYATPVISATSIRIILWRTSFSISHRLPKSTWASLSKRRLGLNRSISRVVKAAQIQSSADMAAAKPTNYGKWAKVVLAYVPLPTTRPTEQWDSS